MLGMLKRHEVEILLKAGHTKTEVARLSGVSLRSVQRIAEECPVGHVDDAKERAQRQIGRPSTVTNFRKQVVEIVQETPDLASLEILRRVRESGYEGGKTALYALVASLRPKPDMKRLFRRHAPKKLRNIQEKLPIPPEDKP
jgi:transposase